MVSASDETVAFQLAQGSGQHALRDPFEPSRQLGMAHRAGHAQGMDDAEGPSVAGMGQHFSFQAAIIVA